VFEGGGVKGIGLGERFQRIEEAGFKTNNGRGDVGGGDHGRARGRRYDAAELKDIVFNMPFPRFKDSGGMSRIPFFGGPLNVLKDLGIYEGKYFHAWIDGLLTAKGIKKFGELLNPEATGLENRHRLRVIASDVTHRRMLILPTDATHLGIDPDEMLVADAVRMSMSIPIFFEPIEIHDEKDEHYDRGRRDAVQLPRLAVRRPSREAAALAHVRADARGAGAAQGDRSPAGQRGRSRHPARLADRLREEHRADDDGSARPHVPRRGDVRAHDRHPARSASARRSSRSPRHASRRSTSPATTPASSSCPAGTSTSTSPTTGGSAPR
jgi:predicted acylesterase/phospholipase RssA